MTHKEQLNADLRDAMRGGQVTRRDTLRLLLSAIHNAEIQTQKELDQAGIDGVIAREVKQRRESIAEYQKANRNDLVEAESAELSVLESYLPPQLSTAEIAEAARRIIAQVGATGPSDKGKVMPVIMAELRGKADGSQINAVVTEQLSALG